MKCISLWQPWATLMAIGAKRIETRSWPTRHRGPLAIHAAKKWTRELSELCATEHFSDALSPPQMGTHDLPFGKIIAVVDLVDCLGVARLERINQNRTPELDAEISATLRFAGGYDEQTIAAALESGMLTERERAFGDYSPGRYGWLTENLRRLPEPVPYAGHQGLFDIPDALVGEAIAAG